MPQHPPQSQSHFSRKTNELLQELRKKQPEQIVHLKQSNQMRNVKKMDFSLVFYHLEDQLIREMF
jgi:hypothetical protein